MKKRGDSFDPKVAKRASIAAAPLAAWVKANVSYAAVLERIAPLEEEQSGLRKYIKLFKYHLFTSISHLPILINNDVMFNSPNIDNINEVLLTKSYQSGFFFKKKIILVSKLWKE